MEYNTHVPERKLPVPGYSPDGKIVDTANIRKFYSEDSNAPPGPANLPGSQQGGSTLTGSAWFVKEILHGNMESPAKGFQFQNPPPAPLFHIIIHKATLSVGNFRETGHTEPRRLQRCCHALQVMSHGMEGHVRLT